MRFLRRDTSLPGTNTSLSRTDSSRQSGFCLFASSHGPVLHFGLDPATAGSVIQGFLIRRCSLKLAWESTSRSCAFGPGFFGTLIQAISFYLCSVREFLLGSLSERATSPLMCDRGFIFFGFLRIPGRLSGTVEDFVDVARALASTYWSAG